MTLSKQAPAILAMVAILGLGVGIMGADPVISSPAGQAPAINWIRLDWFSYRQSWGLHWAFEPVHQPGSFAISDGSGRWLCHGIGPDIRPALAGSPDCTCETDFSPGDGWAGCFFPNRDRFYMLEPPDHCFAWVWWVYADGSKEPLESLYIECPRLWLPIIAAGGTE